MFKNTKATLFTLAAAVAVLIIAAGSPATAEDEITRYDLKLIAHAPQIEISDPGIGVYDPSFSTHTNAPPFTREPELTRISEKPGRDPGPRLGVLRNLRSNERRSFPLWRLMFRITNLRWNPGI